MIKTTQNTCSSQDIMIFSIQRFFPLQCWIEDTADSQVMNKHASKEGIKNSHTQCTCVLDWHFQNLSSHKTHCFFSKQELVHSTWTWHCNSGNSCAKTMRINFRAKNFRSLQKFTLHWLLITCVLKISRSFNFWSLGQYKKFSHSKDFQNYGI